MFRLIGNNIFPKIGVSQKGPSLFPTLTPLFLAKILIFLSKFLFFVEIPICFVWLNFEKETMFPKSEDLFLGFERVFQGI